MEATGKAMMHQELLQNLQLQLDHDCPHGCWKCRATKVLIDIVELHKPNTVPYTDYCDVCVSIKYPCITVQAIERELN
jgi:hypothetical protein